MNARPVKLVAVVLAGGRSSRYGADKLEVDLGGRTLLELALGDLPADAELIVVGPERRINRPARFVREEPPDTGPAAAMIAGLRAALRDNPDAIVVLPGDTPSASRTAMALLAALSEGDRSVMAASANGRPQPLQLALRRDAVEALVEVAGESGAAGQSARVLVGRLKPRSVPVAAEDHFDIDTPADLLLWQRRARC